ncbi:MAG TPA: twin-arginine translocase TatA/TatE family subunit [bacterium]|nr:twin-arginine translocase TatA/TatE family subunit [bacterium]
MFGGIGMQELLLIFLVILLLFGAKRIPDIAHGLGKGIREFKRAMDETKSEIDREINRPATPPEPRQNSESSGTPAP